MLQLHLSYRFLFYHCKVSKAVLVEKELKFRHQEKEALKLFIRKNKMEEAQIEKILAPYRLSVKEQVKL